MSLLDSVVTRAFLYEIGSHAVYLIRKRTLAGRFLPGSTAGSGYSTKPAPMPAGALTKRSIGGFNSLVKSGEARWFTSKAGRKWIVLKGGYKKLRELLGKETNRVTLNFSGKMMKDFNVREVDVAEKRVQLGWSVGELARIASYHDTKGVGKSKKTRKFLGLTKEELSQMAAKAESVVRL